jgi:hypothetical protein
LGFRDLSESVNIEIAVRINEERFLRLRGPHPLEHSVHRKLKAELSLPSSDVPIDFRDLALPDNVVEIVALSRTLLNEGNWRGFVLG